MKKIQTILSIVFTGICLSSYAQISTDEISSFFETKSDPKVVRYRKILKDAGEQCFILYLFNGADKNCQAFAPIVNQFCNRYGWKAIGITLDGKTIEGFTDAKEDNGISQSFDINFAPPAIAIVNPEKNESQLISCGMISLNQLEEGIMKKFEKEITK